MRKVLPSVSPSKYSLRGEFFSRAIEGQLAEKTGQLAEKTRQLGSKTGSPHRMPPLSLHFEGLVQPLYVVDKGPSNLVEQASKRLSCIYEENTYRSRRKDGRQITILPLFGVRVKRADRAREHSNSSKQSAKI